jgi:peroxiredoxin (alkyl hydroperoxide reductase subunit C)
MAAAIGQPAPDFERKDQNGDVVKLSAFQGDKAVALVFYPFSFTGICQGELCQLRDDIGTYEKADVQVIAVSCDPAPSQKEWAAAQGYNFPILSDFWPHGEIAKAYGVFNEERGCANRATFVIGTDGTIVDVFETESLGVAREKARYHEALAKL